MILLKATVGANTITVKEIPVPPKHLMVLFERDVGVHVSRNEMYFSQEEFREFFKPIVDVYNGDK